MYITIDSSLLLYSLVKEGTAGCSDLKFIAEEAIISSISFCCASLHGFTQ